MEIAVISDLHLGRADPSDRFRHDDGVFLRFLAHLERHFEKIVLLGDIWETLGSRRPGDHVRELARARTAHPEIAKRFRMPQYRYVHGNHDLVAGKVDGAPEQIVVRADGHRILFTHGHRHDLLVRRWNTVAEIGAWLGSVLLRHGLEAAFRFAEAWHTNHADRPHDPERCTFRRWALALAGACDADIVVTGHTHRAACEEHGDKLFMNSGTCAFGSTRFLSLDTKAGRFKVHAA